MSKTDSSFGSGWDKEDLDELHNELWALLSFLDEFAINKLDGDEIVRNHISALVRGCQELLDKHGGRFYKP